MQPAALRYAEQAGVVLLPAALEERAEVEQRRTEYAPLAQEQRDEEPANAPVAVEEGMDRLELVV